ncbi:hypothetical protein HPB51_019477 [Rhipicephalus microplus]|uniref:Tick transposon n=1 Tax=Rhipicephalus microplus TaxID=6941 RepID=A0A9J6DBI0_RHIMP|nr:hypothetical protein HPB51_019477 [Rhipicephalus microplus]
MQRRQRECPSSCPSRSSVALLSLPGSPRIVAAASASSTTSMGTSRTLSWPRDSSRLFQCWHHARRGQTVRLRFASRQPPDRDTLSRLQLQVRHARPRPLQCGRFGHVSEACLRAGACIRCGHQHPSADSCNPRCVNYGGGHSADTPTCPRWQEERKVATLLATAPTPLSRQAVKAAVHERPMPGPRRSSLPPVSRPQRAHCPLHPPNLLRTRGTPSSHPCSLLCARSEMRYPSTTRCVLYALQHSAGNPDPRNSSNSPAAGAEMPPHSEKF